jgi:hypothetical protein
VYPKGFTKKLLVKECSMSLILKQVWK